MESWALNDAHTRAMGEAEESQVFDTYYGAPLTTMPEKELWKSVLLLGLADAEHGVQDAIDWLFAKGDGDVHDFVSICEMFGFDPGQVRKTVKIPTRRIKTITRITTRPPRLQVGEFEIDHERDKYDHDFVHSTHCHGCRARYMMAYKRSRGMVASLENRAHGGFRWRKHKPEDAA